MRSLSPQLSFADLELQRQALQLDPTLRAISGYTKDGDKVEWIRDVRRPDHLLEAQLHQRGVPLEAVENVFGSTAHDRNPSSGATIHARICLAEDGWKSS